MIDFELQPTLQNEWVRIEPIKHNDFELLYGVASDPLIWAQHPNKDRYQRDVFLKFFEGALASGGAFVVYDNQTGKPIGSSRFYDVNTEEKSILIGYTFLAVDHWGTTYNKALKTLMLDHAFRFVDNVIFHIGANNIRSQKAIERLGATKIGEQAVAYYGEPEKLNFVYKIEKEQWLKKTQPINQV